MLIMEIITAWWSVHMKCPVEVSIFGVFLVRIFPHSDWIRTSKTPNTDTFYAVHKTLLDFDSDILWEYEEGLKTNMNNNWTSKECVWAVNKIFKLYTPTTSLEEHPSLEQKINCRFPLFNLQILKFLLNSKYIWHIEDRTC